MDPGSITALADLLKSGADAEERGPRQTSQSQLSLTPASLIPNSALPSTHVAKAPVPTKKVKSDKDIWEEDEVQAEEEIEDPNDNRKRPNFDILYKQRVGTEDVYLGMSDKSPSISHCDTMVVRIELPPINGRTVAVADIELDVQEQRLRVSTAQYKLSTYLPFRVRHKEGNAKWDGAKGTLSLTLPMIREDFT